MQIIHRFILALPILTLLVPIGTYIENTTYIRYLADDFCFWEQSKTLGLLPFIIYQYGNWNGRGRFMSFLLMGLVMPQGYRLAWLVVAALLIAWGIALFAVIRLIAHSSQLPHPNMIALFGAALLLLTTFSGSIDPIQELYWQAGAFTYLPPLILFTVLIWLILQPHIGEPLTLFLCGLIAFLASGFSDVYGLLQSAIFLTGAVLYRKQPAPFRRLVIALIGSTIGLVLVVLSPGNGTRVAAYPIPNVVFAISSTLFVSPAPLLVSFYLNPFAMIGLIAFAAGIAYYFDHNRHRRLINWLFIIPFGVVALGALANAPAFYFTSSKLPTHGWMVPQFFAVCGAALWGYGLGLALRGRRAVGPIPRLVTGLGTAFLILLATTGWIRANQTHDRLQIYADAWDKRDSELRAATYNSTQPVAVPLLPDSFELIDVSSDINHEFNLCFAHYYHIPGLIVPKKS